MKFRNGCRNDKKMQVANIDYYMIAYNSIFTFLNNYSLYNISKK